MKSNSAITLLLINVPLTASGLQPSRMGGVLNISVSGLTSRKILHFLTDFWPRPPVLGRQALPGRNVLCKPARGNRGKKAQRTKRRKAAEPLPARDLTHFVSSRNIYAWAQK